MQSDPAVNKTAPLPAVSIRVGAIGHRPNRLDQHTLEPLQAQLLRLLHEVKAIATAAPVLHAPQLPARLLLLSSLAEGTDSMAARAARKLDYELHVVLPFTREEYESTFLTPASIPEFHLLLEKAHSVLNVNAPFSRRDQGFRYAGEILVNQCDLLIAVWDGEDPHGIGGTGETVARALDLGIPVLHVDSRDPARLRWIDESGTHLHSTEQLRSHLEQVFRFDAPPPSKLRSGVRAKVEAWWNAPTAANQYRVQRWPRVPALPLAYLMVRALADGRLKWPASPSEGADVSDIQTPTLKRYFHWADALAIRYGELSRSASLAIQLFTAATIFSSLLIVLVETLLVKVAGQHLAGVTVLRSLSGLESIATLAILIIFAVAKKFRWHTRWLCYRAVAEQIRSLDILHPLGLALPRARGFSAEDNPLDEEVFSGYLLQGIVRELGLACSVINHDFIEQHLIQLNRVIDHQARFHHATTERYEKVERFLTRSSLLVFAMAAMICVIDFYSLFTGKEATSITTALAVLVPAIGATLATLSTQGEFKRLARRSGGMLRTLELIKARLKRKECTDLHDLNVTTIQVAEVFLTEVRQWMALVWIKSPSLG